VERKFKIIFILVLTILTFFEFRLFQLQIVNGKKYRNILESYMTKLEDIPAPRGRIYDRKGRLIADSIPIFNLYLDLEKYRKASNKDKKKFIDIFSDTIPDLKEKLKRKNNIIILTELGLQQYKKFEDLIAEFTFLSYQRSYRRRYYGPKSLSHIVGYTDLKGNGKSGIEKEYDSLLKGEDGLKYVKVDAYGNEINVIKTVNPISGDDLYLTIDVDLQRKLEELLTKLDRPSCAIAFDPSNGEILAMVSYPFFDSNIFSDGLTEEEWKELSEDPSFPLLNRCISSTYLPGSIIKPFTALAALYYDLVDPLKIWNCSGKYEIFSKDGKTIATYKDWISFGHGKMDLEDALKVSCNTYFYNLGVKVGIRKLSEFAKLIGLDQKTGIDLPGEVSGLYPSIDWKRKRFNEDWYIGDTVLVSIGQGYVSLTPIEIASLYSLIANEGRIFKPYILKKIVSEAIPEKHEIINPKLTREITLSKEKWKILKEGLEKVVNFPGSSVVDRGTAYNAFKGFRYQVAGKTGTAEISDEEPTHAWFACFSPSEKPSIALVVFVDRGGYGGHTAAPIAREFLDYYYSLNK